MVHTTTFQQIHSPYYYGYYIYFIQVTIDKTARPLARFLRRKDTI